MEDNRKDILDRIKEVENKVQSGELTRQESSKDLNEAVKELRAIVTALDKDSAIQAEKQSHLFYQIGQLERSVSELKTSDTRAEDSKKDLVEKVFMVVLGAAVTYFFSMLKQ